MKTMRSQRGAMPTWAKVLLGIFAICAVLTVGIVWYCINVATKMGKEMTDPKAAAALAHELVELEDPLPSGWSYFANMNIGMVRMVTIHNDKGTVIVNITRYFNKLSKDLADGQARGAKMTVVSRGTDTLAGQTVEYLRGDGSMKGQHVAEQIDYGATKDGGTVTVQVFEVGANEYDPALAEPFLDRIKSLK